jgi:hypothetical protein
MRLHHGWRAAFHEVVMSDVCVTLHESSAILLSSPVHAQVDNHFTRERHLVTRQVHKQRRLAALEEWRALAA